MSEANEYLIIKSSVFCNDGCKKEIFFEEVSAKRAFKLFDDNQKLEAENTALKSELESLRTVTKWVDESLSEFGEGGFGISQEELVEFYNEYKDEVSK